MGQRNPLRKGNTNTMHTLTLSQKAPARTTAYWLTAAQRDAVVLLIDSALNGYQGPNEHELKEAVHSLTHPLRYIEAYDVGTTNNARWNMLDDGHLACIGADIVAAIKEDEAGNERRPGNAQRWRSRDDSDEPQPTPRTGIATSEGDPHTWR